MGRDETAITLAGRTIGVGLCVPALLMPAVPDGGLAPLAVAALVAVLVGVPAAQAEWRALRPPPTLHLAGLLLVAGVAAPIVREAGLLGITCCVAGWTGALVLGSSPRATWWAAVGLLAIAAGRAAFGIASSPGVTLAAARWTSWTVWLGPAIVAGALAGAAGLGPFTVGPRRVPGRDATPWASAGAALLLATALVWQTGARYEATLGATIDDAGRDAILAGAALLGAAAVVGPRAPVGSGAPVRAAAGALATLWLAGPGHGSVPLVLGGVVPLLAAGALVHAAWTMRTTDAAVRSRSSSLAPWIAAAAVLGGVAVWPPSLPTSVTAGAAGGVLLAVAFWVVATRAVLARESA